MTEKIIAFWGYPNPDLISKIKNQYPSLHWLDLDVDYGYPQTNILPDAYCKIIKNIFDNAMYLKDKIQVILAPIGKDKCDSGWFAAQLLKDRGFNVIESIFENFEHRKNLNISTSKLPLKEKINLITKNIIEEKEYNLEQCKPEFGFWGVPPNDLEVLDLFPNTTHVYGWTRCVEAKVPADIELEMFIDKDVPTVFYAQAFCSKCQLAKYLADTYNGLYIDIDDFATTSVKAKIEAFLRLR